VVFGMITRVVAVRETAGYGEMITAMRRWLVSACRVLDHPDQVIAVVSGRACCPTDRLGTIHRGNWVRAGGRHSERAKAAGADAAELMGAPPVTVGPNASVAGAARPLGERGSGLRWSIRPGGWVGIVSRADVMGVIHRPDRQIRNDVMHKRSSPGCSRSIRVRSR
jgi:hypothetical protein